MKTLTDTHNPADAAKAAGIVTAPRVCAGDSTTTFSPADTPRGGSLGVLPRPLAAALVSTALVWPALAGRRWGPHRLVPGVWYRLLRKPSFQPPDRVIPVAWSLIDTALTVGGYRLLRQPSSDARTRALGWWAFNVAMIGGWSGIFFGRRNLPASTAAAATMVGTGAAYVGEAWRVDKPAAAAGLPYIGWVAFATVLTAALWRRNR